MNQLQLFDKYDYPFPNTLLISGRFNDHRIAFEAMLLKKQESLQNYCARANSSQFIADRENDEIQKGWDMLEMADFIFNNTVEELERQHLYEFATADKPKLFTITSDDGEISSSCYLRYDRKKVKSLQLEINKLKAELNIQ